VPSRQLAAKPVSISHAEAAALPMAGLTAWQALVATADVAEGDRVLIHGAGGGVGHLAVQIAKSRGAYVLGTASAGKHDFLRGLGADQLVDYRTADFEAVVEKVDVVLDLIAGGYAGTIDRRTPAGRSADERDRTDQRGARRGGPGGGAQVHRHLRRA
jgi:NADPH:quinone reductase-like Zn-dependent oxidoreductase